MSPRWASTPAGPARTPVHVAAGVVVPDYASSHDTLECTPDLRAATAGRYAVAAGAPPFPFLSMLVRAPAQRGAGAAAPIIVRGTAAGLPQAPRISKDSVQPSRPAGRIRRHSRSRQIRSDLFLPVLPPVCVQRNPVRSDCR